MKPSHWIQVILYKTSGLVFLFFVVDDDKKQTQKHDFAQHGVTPVQDTCPFSSVSSTR